MAKEAYQHIQNGYIEKTNIPWWKDNWQNKTGIPTTLNQTRTDRWAHWYIYYEVWCKKFGTGRKEIVVQAIFGIRVGQSPQANDGINKFCMNICSWKG